MIWDLISAAAVAAPAVICLWLTAAGALDEGADGRRK